MIVPKVRTTGAFGTGMVRPRLSRLAQNGQRRDLFQALIGELFKDRISKSVALLSSTRRLIGCLDASGNWQLGSGRENHCTRLRDCLLNDAHAPARSEFAQADLTGKFVHWLRPRSVPAGDTVGQNASALERSCLEREPRRAVIGRPRNTWKP
jgi:hypothetical protein